jgi:hypothetical protein
MKRLISLPLLFASLLIPVILVGGCDDSSDKVNKAILEQAAKPPEDPLKPPTTQELLTAHRSRTALMPLPLTMELPPGWGPDRRAHMPNILTGYTPSGNEIQIQLITRSSIKRDALNRLVAGAKKEMASNPSHIIRVDLRPLAEGFVFERQRLGDPAELVTYDKNNVPHSSIETGLSWSVEVMVPHDDAYQVHELSFLALTKNQYDQDKDFLNGILSSLAYTTLASESSATTSLSTTAPATRATPTTAPSLH